VLAVAVLGGCSSDEEIPGVTPGAGGSSAAGGAAGGAGAGGAAGAGGIAGAPPAAGGAQMPPDTTPVTITVWRHDNASYRKAGDDAFADYTAAHPNVTITPTTVDWLTYTHTLDADLKRDQFPYDVLLMPPAVTCGFAANLADVPADVIALADARAAFFAPPLDASTCGGVLKGLPIEYNLEYGGVIVNLDKWAAKFPTRQPGWTTWEAFIADAAALVERDPMTGKPCNNGLDIDPDWPEPVRHILLSQILQRGGKYWKPSGDLFDLQTPEAKASLAAMVSWVNVNKVMTPELIPEANSFVTLRLGRGATGFGCGDVTAPLSIMGYVGTWGLPASMAERPPGSQTHFGFYALPPMVGTEHKFVQNAGFALTVPRTAKNPRVAWDVIKSMALSPAAMKKWAGTAGTLPALKANGTKEAVAGDPVLVQVQPLLEHGQWMGYIPAASTAPVLGAMVTNFFAAVKGTKTVDQALADMEKTANDAIIQNR
jgi:multiple sugar transport system substrate-binding protein